MDHPLQIALSEHRPALVRWFTHLSGDPQSAEDMAQETLVEAWAHRARLTNPSGAKPWINAIGANVYKRWCRRRGLETRRLANLDDDVPDTDSDEIDLDRDELAGLLDHALTLLPPESRALLTARYLENLPQAELARRFHISESAAAVRLHRGKLLLRRLVESEANGDGWQQTNIWCMACGQAHYEGRFDSATGEFVIRCPRCLPVGMTAWEHAETGGETVIRGMKSMKPAMYRLMAWNDRQFRPVLAGGEAICAACGQPVSLRREHVDFVRRLMPDLPGVHTLCPHCGHLNASALSGIGISTPQGIAFWKVNPRIRHLPMRRVEHEGRPSLVIAWQSVLDPRRELAVLFAEDTYEVLSVIRDDDRN